MFDCVIAALVHGSGYERVAVPGCSDRTIRRRLQLWVERGVTKDLLRTALAGYDRMLGLNQPPARPLPQVTALPLASQVQGDQTQA